jgi:hypothetical protein
MRPVIGIGTVLVLLCTAVPTYSQDHQPLFTRGDIGTLATMIGGQFADVQSTRWYLTNGSGCTEGNPNLADYPTTSALLKQKAFTLGVTTGISLLIRLAASDHVGDRPSSKHTWRIARAGARALEIGAGAYGARTAIGNWRTCRKGR